MHTLTAGDLLTLWERGAGLHAIDRSLLLLALALPDRAWRDLARLSLGERDTLLLTVRRATLGDRLDAHDTCPACGERVEIDLTCSALLDTGCGPPGEWSIAQDGYRLTLRPLTSEDAAAAAICGSVAAARATLLARSIAEATRDNEPVTVGDLPDEIVWAAGASMAEHDTRAELVLELACPQCQHQWQNVLDVARFVWTELAARAHRLLVDVHTIARAYGWSESDILALSDARRAAYLHLVSA